MPRLKWITDEALEAEVQRLVAVGKIALEKKQQKKEFNKNTVDPFSALFTMAGFDLTHQEWFISETTRQAQKTLQNHVGNFHEQILSKVEGWELIGNNSTFDLHHASKRIIAEVKNKYNTVKQSDLVNLQKSLHDLVSDKSSRYKDYTAYYVAILPKSGERYNTPFVTSDNKTGRPTTPNELVRTIDGASFYALVTGEDNAIFDLYAAVVDILVEMNMDRTELEHINEYLERALKKQTK